MRLIKNVILAPHPDGHDHSNDGDKGELKWKMK